MRNKKDDFSVFQRKIAIRFIGGMLVSIVLVIALYLFLWKRRVGDWIVSLIEFLLKIKHEEAFMIYHLHFRANREIFFAAASILLFSVLLLFLFRCLTRYFKEINRGIDHLLAEDQKAITLSPEMYPFENKLNTVKQTLQERKEATVLAEQRKDDLVMYLAHDIRTPLTSVIGYLSLMAEETDMTADDREKNVQIALKKACHLQEMINEFFEIARYNAQQIKLSKKPIDNGEVAVNVEGLAVLRRDTVQDANGLDRGFGIGAFGVGLFGRRGDGVKELAGHEADVTVIADARPIIIDKLDNIDGRAAGNRAASAHAGRSGCRLNSEVQISGFRDDVCGKQDFFRHVFFLLFAAQIRNGVMCPRVFAYIGKNDAVFASARVNSNAAADVPSRMLHFASALPVQRAQLVGHVGDFTFFSPDIRLPLRRCARRRADAYGFKRAPDELRAIETLNANPFLAGVQNGIGIFWVLLGLLFKPLLRAYPPGRAVDIAAADF